MMNTCPPSEIYSNNRDWLAAINQQCLCLDIDRQRIDADLISSIAHSPTLRDELAQRPNLFAKTPIFLAPEDFTAMVQTVKAVDAAIALPAYQQARQVAGQTTAFDSQTHGLVMSFDFHLIASGPRLIEINTNAGGAFLAAQLAADLGAKSGHELQGNTASEFLVNMIRREWQQDNADKPLGTVAIVDDQPSGEYLYPDMLIAQRLLQSSGINALIVAASDLVLQDNRLMVGDQPIDLIYNRLTDFSLSEPAHQTMKLASQRGVVTISPNPTHHARYADKRNLALLSDFEQLKTWGLDDASLAALATLPKTELVTAESATDLWQRRKRLFFKPTSGFGGKAVYRGSKLTKKTWQHILHNDYVAQTFVPPGLRAVQLDGAATKLKFDVRLYTYAGEPFQLVARLYQGQATNFRTPGGGFAPVIVTDQCP